MIRKLSQEVINQIAAGEVIERPSSVIKELVDNAIDANSTKIDIKIKGGGKKYIEVSDNGFGISKDDLKNVFEAHATSKIQGIEDLNNLISMGFRGEALSTILSVSKVQLISKCIDDEYAYNIFGEGVDISEPQKIARDNGTTVIVQNLFENIPARYKYLRADNTEYKKILDLLIPYFLINPNIHFTFFNNGKEVYNLPAVFNFKSRVRNVLKGDFVEDMLDIFSEGDGMKIEGVLAQPRYVFDKTQHQYFFLNNRLIKDRGIIRAVSEGLEGFVPKSKKVPFFINLTIKPSLVDINVHPRKEEVRFINPFRVYIAVQKSIEQTLKNYSHKEVETPVMDLRDKPRVSKVKEVNYKRNSSYNVQSGLKFSEQLLKSSNKPRVVKQNDMSLFKTELDDFKCFQIFNKYIVVEFEKEVWVVDQHAASERVQFEKLKRPLNSQSLLIPFRIDITEVERYWLKENIVVFEKFGFNINVVDDSLEVVEIPEIFVSVDLNCFFQDLFSEDFLDKKFSDLNNRVLSVLACHSSVRSGQRLSEFEMKGLIKDLKSCENSISCPHGRPIIWKLSLSEIDKHFYRND